MLRKITPAQITLMLYVALLLLEAFAAYNAEAKTDKDQINRESQKIKDLEERVEILEKYIIISDTKGCKSDEKNKPEGFNSIMHREAIYNQMKKR